MSNNSTENQPLMKAPMNATTMNTGNASTITPSQIHTSHDGTETSYILQQSPPGSSNSEVGVDDEVFEDDNNNNNSNDEEEISLSLNEILYAFSSYHAIVKPVTITMILSALAVLIINTEDTIRQGEEEMTSFYTVWKPPADSSDESTGQTLARAFANSFVIVSAICLMTFGIVLLYKFRCMKCLLGYMIFSSSMLLGVMGGTMMDVAIEKFRIPISKITYFFMLYNFAIVGTTAIFYQSGIPTYVTQGYLVLTSVILAWQLSHFDEWTTWSLLVMLALYDLCAVLTPCGPLKALVGLMQQEGSPDMPGLLYEAELPSQVTRPGNAAGNNTNSPPSNANFEESVGNEDSQHPPSDANYSQPTPSSAPNTIMLPLAIARIYRLPILPTTTSPSTTAPLLQNTDHIQTSNTYTPTQLKSQVQAVLPNSGARIDTTTNNMDGQPRYVVRDRDGNIKRTLLLDNNGRVFEELDEDDDSTSSKEKSTIKLGLGDFIFYSVLVSKAAMYSFATFMACMLVILAGLGMTLVLLSVYHKALPALPISIFLGVGFYLVTRLVIEPWIEDIMRVPFYL